MVDTQGQRQGRGRGNGNQRSPHRSGGQQGSQRWGPQQTSSQVPRQQPYQAYPSQIPPTYQVPPGKLLHELCRWIAQVILKRGDIASLCSGVLQRHSSSTVSQISDTQTDVDKICHRDT